MQACGKCLKARGLSTDSMIYYELELSRMSSIVSDSFMRARVSKPLTSVKHCFRYVFPIGRLFVNSFSKMKKRSSSLFRKSAGTFDCFNIFLKLSSPWAVNLRARVQSRRFSLVEHLNDLQHDNIFMDINYTRATRQLNR